MDAIHVIVAATQESAGNNMTCIAGWVDRESGNIWMGADSAITDGWHTLIRKTPKVFSIGNALMGEAIVGLTGFPRTAQVLRYQMVVPEHPEGMDTIEYLSFPFVDAMRKSLRESCSLKKFEGKDEMDSSFLFGYRGRLCQIESNFTVSEYVSCFSAIGSGESYAFGALEIMADMDMPGELKVLRALEVAAKHSIGVCGPFHVEFLEGRGRY